MSELRRLISEHSIREGLWVLLLEALDLAGRRAEAIAAFGEARSAISDELGVDPGPELRRIYQRLLAADRAESDAADGPGEAELPGERAGAEAAGRAERDPDAGLADAAAVAVAGAGGASEPGGPGQLPADVADFTGRHEHLLRLRQMLTPASSAANPAAVNIAGVVGTPGLGKTVLAVHAAHALRRNFPDGQLFVSLLGASQQPAKPDEVLARLLRDLGVEPDRIPATLEERAALYRTRLTDRRVLLVLDDARDSAQVRPLLPGSASCAVIVTSRHWLSDLAGSRLVDLDVLDDDEAEQMLTRIIGEDRVTAEPGPVRDVLRACAGLPLAIRIAGARLAARRGWTVATMARRLADERHRLDELTAGDLAVRACFEVSFTSLPQPAAPGTVDPARAFRLLGLWQGPDISLQAAAALLDERRGPGRGRAGDPGRRAPAGVHVLGLVPIPRPAAHLRRGAGQRRGAAAGHPGRDQPAAALVPALGRRGLAPDQPAARPGAAGPRAQQCADTQLRQHRRDADLEPARARQPGRGHPAGRRRGTARRGLEAAGGHHAVLRPARVPGRVAGHP